MDKVILEFQDEYRFLSNFCPSPFYKDGYNFPTVEHFYQSMKTYELSEMHEMINAPSPSYVKRLGQNCSLRDDWGDIKDSIMEVGVYNKFEQNSDLRKMLLDTGNAYLIEGNRWGDEYWGYNLKTGYGLNKLGHILMYIRRKFR